MIGIKVEGVEKTLKVLSPKRIPSAARMAINDGARAGRTTAGKGIRERWNIKAAKLNDELKNIKMATNSNLVAIIQAKGRPISLTYFDAKWTRGRRVTTGKSSKTLKRAASSGGVTVRILKGQVTRLPHAFIAATRAGKTGTYLGVFQRSGDDRLPIVNKAAVTIATMFNQKPIFDRTVETIIDRAESRFEHHLSRDIK